MSLTDPQPEGTSKESQGTSVLQTLNRVGSVGLIIAALYLGWVFYSRHASDEKAAQELAEKQAEDRKREAALIFGSGEIKIVTWAVDKESIGRGESADLCYGVINANKVVIEPHVEDTKPYPYHCMQISPKVTTKYTITASNEKGDSKSLAVTLRVH